MTREKKNAWQAAYVAANREAINARRRARYAANREEELAKINRWRDENRERYNATRRRYWAKNTDKLRPKLREYYRKNREILLAKLRKKNEDFGRKLYERRRERWEANPALRDKALARVKEWQEGHPEVMDLYYAKRLLAAQAGLTFRDIPDDLAEAKLLQLEIQRMLRIKE